jgi:hypothetical protein
VLHQARREEQDHPERERRAPELQQGGLEEVADRREGRQHVRGHVDGALHEQPPDAGEEPADDRVRDEPDEVRAPEGPEHHEGDPGQDRHDQTGGDDGDEGPLDAPERGDRDRRRDGREHDRRGRLQSPDHPPGAREPGEDPERQRSRPQVQADALRDEVLDAAAEHEGGERHREDRLDGADDQPDGDPGQPSAG